MRLVGRSEYHLIRGILRVVPLLDGHQISRFDGKCIDQGGLAVPDIGQRILNEPVNRTDIVCVEGGEVSCVGRWTGRLVVTSGRRAKYQCDSRGGRWR